MRRPENAQNGLTAGTGRKQGGKYLGNLAIGNTVINCFHLVKPRHFLLYPELHATLVVSPPATQIARNKLDTIYYYLISCTPGDKCLCQRKLEPKARSEVRRIETVG